MMTPDDILEAQERRLYAIAKLDVSPDRYHQELEDLQEGLRALRAQLTEWLVDGGYEPRWERWPVAARAYVRSTR